MQVRCGIPDGARGGPDPAGGVALGGPAIDRRPGDVEPRRGAEVEALEEGDDAARLGQMAGSRECDRDRRRVARPDVGPAVAGAGDRGSGARGR